MTEPTPDEELLWTALFGPMPGLEMPTDDQAAYDAMFSEE